MKWVRDIKQAKQKAWEHQLDRIGYQSEGDYLFAQHSHRSQSVFFSGPAKAFDPPEVLGSMITIKQDGSVPGREH